MDGELQPYIILSNRNSEALMTVRESGIHLKDIVIVSRPQDSHFAINTLQIVISGSKDLEDRKTLTLERASSEMWKYNGVIDLPAISNELRIVARSEEFGDIGHVRLWGDDFRNIRARSPLDHRVARQFVTEGEGPILTASFQITPSFLASGKNMALGNRWPSPLKAPEPMEEGRRTSCTAHTCTDGHVNVLPLLNGLGNLFYRQFKGILSLTRNRQMISSQQEMIRLTAVGEAELPSLLNKLGILFHQCFESTGDLSDISEAISAYRRAVQLTPDGHADKSRRLDDFGIALYCRFIYTGCFTDISESVSAHQKAVQLTADGHADMSTRLTHLGNALCGCFEYTGDLADISEAISVHQKAVQLTPDGPLKKPPLLGNLGHAFCCRYECTQDLADMSRAILAYRRAVELAADTSDIYFPFLSGPLSLFHYRFRVAHTSDLAETVSVNQSLSDIAQQLYSLGNLFHRRFQRTGNLVDVSRAISAYQRVVQFTSDGQSEMPRRLNILGHSFRSRSERTGDLADIMQAISTIQRALHLIPDSHADTASFLNNLVDSFRLRFKQTGDLKDISEAISFHQRLVQISSDHDANMASHLNKLGDSFQLRFKCTGDPVDISEAISAHQRIIQLTPDGHAEMTSRLNSLGELFQLRFECTGDLLDTELAISNYRLGATNIFGPPEHRLEAARKWAKLSQIDNASKSLEAYHVAIELISQISGLEQTIEHCYYNLEKISDLSTIAAATAISVGKPDMALEWLEQGRCIVWGQLNSLRTPLDKLRSADPRLANDILAASRALEAASHRTNRADNFLNYTIIDLSNNLDRQRSNISNRQESNFLNREKAKEKKLAQDWKQVLSTVRAIPEFEDFLQPSPCSRLLKHLPESGFVVVINMANDRCDALVLIRDIDTPRHIPLKDFSYNQAVNLRRLLKKYLAVQGVRCRGSEPELRGTCVVTNKGADIREILRQLWLHVVKPVLDGLGFSHPLSVPLQIWWCTTGPLAFLPIHAAGIYGRDEQTHGSILSDYAISSYTPTVSALNDRVKNIEKVVRKTIKPLMISQPNTPRLTPIPNTTKEMRAIHEELTANDIQALLLDGRDATIARVSKEMETYSHIHLAFHAIQDIKEPLKSGFELNDGRLKLSEVIKKQLSMAALAFLSACQTCSGDEQLSEEAVHLGAGMLAAGYQGVIATMWSIQDRYGPEIAKDFYTYLLSRGSSEEKKGFNDAPAAHALHYAIQCFRKKYGDSEDSLIAWVPYVHMGL